MSPEVRRFGIVSMRDRGCDQRLRRRVWSCCGLVFAAFFLSGCSYFSNQVTPGRFEHGYTIILPGIEGRSVANSNLAQGLKNSGYPGAIEIDNWTTGSFLFFPVHLRNQERNRREAARIAEKIVIYKDRYPGRPVHLIGHSGGSGIALLTLEALPPGYQVTSATLLQSAVSPEYDLSKSLKKTQVGLWSYHSPLDVLLLGAGTTVCGTFDGRHKPAAGWLGFRTPKETDADQSPQDVELYERKLHQQVYSLRMLASGNLGGHLGPTWLGFSHKHLAPILAEAETHPDAMRTWSAIAPVSIPVHGPAMPGQPSWLNAVHMADYVDEPRTSNRVQPASAEVPAGEHWPIGVSTVPDRTE